jgi:hypothetical protein
MNKGGRPQGSKDKFSLDMKHQIELVYYALQQENPEKALQEICTNLLPRDLLKCVKENRWEFYKILAQKYLPNLSYSQTNQSVTVSGSIDIKHRLELADDTAKQARLQASRKHSLTINPQPLLTEEPILLPQDANV